MFFRLFFILQLVLHILPKSNPITKNSNPDHKNTNPATQELKPRSQGHKWKQEEKTQIQHLRDRQTQHHQIYHKSRSSNSSCSSPSSNTINTKFLANQTQIKPKSRNQSQQTQINTIKPKPTQSNPDPTTNDWHNQATTTLPIKNISS